MVINISGIIFLDLDGTLLDTSKRHYNLYKDILDENGVAVKEPVLSKENFWHMKRVGKKTQDILPQYLPNDALTSFEEKWVQRIEKKAYLQYDEPFPETKEILSYLNQEFDLVLVTLRNNTKNLHWELSKLGLNIYFKSIINGKGPKKNLVENYLTHNYAGEKCLIVGDTEEDIKTGLELNMVTISVTCGIRSKEFLEQFNADYCINNFKDIVNIIKS